MAKYATGKGKAKKPVLITKSRLLLRFSKSCGLQAQTMGLRRR